MHVSPIPCLTDNYAYIINDNASVISNTSADSYMKDFEGKFGYSVLGDLYSG